MKVIYFYYGRKLVTLVAIMTSPVILMFNISCLIYYIHVAGCKSPKVKI